MFFFNRFIQTKDDIIEAQQKRISALEVEVSRERQRADIAIDRLLALKEVGTVMPEKVRIAPLAPMDAELKRKLDEHNEKMKIFASEFGLIGDLGGEPLPGGLEEKIV